MCDNKVLLWCVVVFSFFVVSFFLFIWFMMLINDEYSFLLCIFLWLIIRCFCLMVLGGNGVLFLVWLLCMLVLLSFISGLKEFGFEDMFFFLRDLLIRFLGWRVLLFFLFEFCWCYFLGIWVVKLYLVE